jgi:hypothetical protein
MWLTAESPPKTLAVCHNLDSENADGSDERSQFRMSRLRWVFPFFSLVCVAGVIGIVFSFLHIAGLKPSDGITLFAGLFAAGIIWWQGYLIKLQMELQAVIELHKEWNSGEMRKKRRSAWNDRNRVDKYRIEDVLEFLEKVSTFERHGAVTSQMIWATFGWYLWRYYHYSSEAIQELRQEWTPKKPDSTLYEDMQALYDKLLKQEVMRRNVQNGPGLQVLTEQDIKEELEMTREKFVTSERRLAHD